MAAPPGGDAAYLEVFPRHANRNPRLLEELQAELLERLTLNQRAACATLHQPRDPNIAANLALDAHRQVLSSFIAGFPGFAELLTRIKTEMDDVIDAGTKCAMENAALQQQLQTVKEQRKQSAARVRMDSQMAAARELVQVQRDVDEADGHRAMVERRAAAAARELETAGQQLARQQQLLDELKATNARLKLAAGVEDRWQKGPLAAAMADLMVGPLSRTEEDQLEADIVISPASEVFGTASSVAQLTHEQRRQQQQQQQQRKLFSISGHSGTSTIRIVPGVR